MTATSTKAECLAVINLFGRELVHKRGVRIDSFVFDDGWDDPRTLWGFHAGFPRRFPAATKTPRPSATRPWACGCRHLAVTAADKEERLKYGRTQGFEINSRGFALAGPKYYARFRDACRQMIEKYGVNYFKFDGIAAGLDYDKPYPGGPGRHRRTDAALPRNCEQCGPTCI